MRRRGLLGVFMTLGLLVSLSGPAPAALANTPNPTSVTIAGDLQAAAGCSGNWQPDCAATHLAYSANSDVWRAAFALPAGSYQYKAALNDSWTENYGLHAVAGGANIPLALSAAETVRFYYDHKTHWVTDSHNSVIASVPGSYQQQLGCSGNWDPGCLRSWLEDPSGSGTYSFQTTALRQGSYEAKVALDESWTVNYGQGGVQNGPNIVFSVPVDHAKVTFAYNPTSHVLGITAEGLNFAGLRHDSRDLLYRTPGGAVPAGSAVTLRFRTLHDNATAVKVRVYDLNSGQRFYKMARVAADVSCYQAGLEASSCDYWAVTLTRSTPDNLWYRFIVNDGGDTGYYADDTSALDGGLGQATRDPIDNSYALMFYEPAFTVPAWARHAVIYQIFPDRFRNGSTRNDPQTGDPRYDEPVITLPWGTLPEGYCRNYTVPDSQCPWRFDATKTGREGPRGRDYFGGDLQGISEKLGYLQELGIDTIYLNPIFFARSNHRYDTADYRQIDPYLGDLRDFQKLVHVAHAHHIRIILDGVFNHMSSDSPFFNRYQHFAQVGACNSAESTWRSWFTFRPPVGNEPAACVPSTPGGADTFYNGWFGFDSIPVLSKANPQVQNYFVRDPDSVSRYWLEQGAQGWRLDVMGDPSFPSGYWEAFRQVVKQEDPEALIIGELWQKDSTLVRFLRGDRADTTMDYRFRDAVVGLFTAGNFDSKGFADSGHRLSVSQFESRLQSIREDYPDAAYFSLMNLMDSHDTERMLWTFTPGQANQQDKEFNAANLAVGKSRVQLASLIQFTMPGSPTIYYGDEVGMTGADDPDDRRTYPWIDQGGHPDLAMLAHYEELAQVRKEYPVLSDGDLRFLLADDAHDTLAYGRKTGSQAAIVAINRGEVVQMVDISVAGYLPEGLKLSGVAGVGNPVEDVSAQVTAGRIHLMLNPRSAIALVAEEANLTPPSAPAGLGVTGEGNGQVALSWGAVQAATGYNVYRSPVTGGGFVKVNSQPLSGTTFTDTGLRNAQNDFYVVTAVDATGNESAWSNEVVGMPHLVIAWANLQWPFTLTQTISAVHPTDNVYGQVYIAGATNQPGATPTLQAQLGFGPSNSIPAGNPQWRWVDASFNVNAGNNNEFKANLLPDTIGSFDYTYRYTTTAGRDWVYADRSGISSYDPAKAGKMTVVASTDTTPPVTPSGLHVVSASPGSISLAWNAVTGDPTMYGYEVRKADAGSATYTTLTLTTDASFTDTDVVEGASYSYLVRAVDTSFNRSPDSAPVVGTAALRTVSLVFTVTVPASTPVGKTVYIAGFLDRLDGGLPQWNPGGVSLRQVDATHWTITLTGKEFTQIEYKYTLGSWDFVEKSAACAEISNRQLTLSYGSSGTQSVNDTVANWRNVAPCGN
jgi:glycosidase